MSKLLNEEIVSINKIAWEIYKITIKSEYVSKNALPGQFVNIKCSEGITALLRRPISICDVDKAAGTFDVCFQIKGIGTEYLTRKTSGELLDIIAPVGNPFYISRDYKRIAVVGGGIGVFPLLYLLKENVQAERHTFLGYRNKDHVVLENEYKNASDKYYISTDDGSAGYKGLVTDLLEKELQEKGLDIIYACGPTPMIRKVIELSKKYKTKCQVSMEQRMGCGIGACLVCACKTKAQNEDGWEYSHVCKDGPVFWSDEVILD
ncbi:MAG TPA: dihydroorotate dehydrogenase electron transfer subunit [Pseudobacteroides sp.]|uniref:dihydroorotate dehydrogenase electron transfer subunit n=1 Tax=Pseudobacteroides sp. TaxID=1968840 RepID=UPI002F926236